MMAVDATQSDEDTIHRSELERALNEAAGSESEGENEV